jgi:two-component system, LytTR family, response regulator
MLNCVIIDDESSGIRLLSNYIEKTPILNLIHTNTDSIEGYNFIVENANDIDLLFLDIQMPELTGTELIKLIQEKISTVFTTAYKDYAVEAFELGAVDYLMKPIVYEKFIKCVNKIAAKIETKTKAEHFFVYIDKKLVKIQLNEVFYVKGLGNFLEIFLINGSKYLTSSTFEDIERNLKEPNFIRINKSYLISFSSILSIEGNEVRISRTKSNDATSLLLPIGPTYKKHFLGLVNRI